MAKKVTSMPVKSAKSTNAASGNKQAARTTGNANNAYGQARKATVQARNAARKAAKLKK